MRFLERLETPSDFRQLRGTLGVPLADPGECLVAGDLFEPDPRVVRFPQRLRFRSWQGPIREG